MLKRLLSGSMLEDELWGIDDPVVVDSIRRACIWRSTTIAPALGLMGICICGAAVVELVKYVLAWYAWPEYVTVMVATAAGVRIGTAHLRRCAMRALPDVLRSMGRCTDCGYKLDAVTSERCPECGHTVRAIESQRPAGR